MTKDPWKLLIAAMSGEVFEDLSCRVDDIRLEFEDELRALRQEVVELRDRLKMHERALANGVSLAKVKAAEKLLRKVKGKR